MSPTAWPVPTQGDCALRLSFLQKAWRVLFWPQSTAAPGPLQEGARVPLTQAESPGASSALSPSVSSPVTPHLGLGCPKGKGLGKPLRVLRFMPGRRKRVCAVQAYARVHVCTRVFTWTHLRIRVCVRERQLVSVQLPMRGRLPPRVSLHPQPEQAGPKRVRGPDRKPQGRRGLAHACKHCLRNRPRALGLLIFLRN